MTVEEIKQKIDDLESSRFYLNMKDRWSNEDYDYDRELCRKICELREQLEEATA